MWNVNNIETNWFRRAVIVLILPLILAVDVVLAVYIALKEGIKLAIEAW